MIKAKKVLLFFILQILLFVQTQKCVLKWFVTVPKYIHLYVINIFILYFC